MVFNHLPSALCRCIVLGIVSCCLVSCEEDEVDRLTRVAPGLDEDLARHFVLDDEDEFLAYSEEVGFYWLVRAASPIWQAYRQPTLDSFRKIAPILDPCQLRLANAFTQVFAHDGLVDRHRRELSLPMERRYVHHQLDARMREYADSLRVVSDDDVRHEEALAQWHRFLAAADSIGVGSLDSRAALEIAEHLNHLDRDQQARSWRWRAVEGLIAAGNMNMACQALGELGATYRGMSRPDSMRICWDRALRLAQRCRIPDQAARILEFYGNYYWRLGQLTAAFDFYHRAVEVCRDFKGGPAELRFLLNVLDSHADFECWDVVGRDLARGYVLAPQLKENESPAPVALGLAEARYRMGMGWVAEADSVYAETLEAAIELPWKWFAVDTLYHWAVGLLDWGLPARALDRIGLGLEYGEALDPPRVREARFRLVAAKAHFDLGQYERAEEERRRFQQISRADTLEARLRLPWVEQDALGVRLAMAIGDRVEATKRLRQGFERLQRYLVTVDASAEGYLFLRQISALRAAMHEVVGADASLGYALEMAWRHNALLLGAESRHGMHETPDSAWDECIRLIDIYGELGPPGSDPPEPLEIQGLLDWLGPDDAHVVYWVGPDRVVRWTATRTTVSRDVLAASVEEIGALASRAIRSLATPHPPQAPCNADLADDLRSLSGALLPALPPAGAGGPPVLLVSPDGPLDALSFETLNVADRGYTPLLRRRDVAYLHHIRGPRARQAISHPGIALTEPVPPRSIQRRHHGIRPLERGDDEVRELASFIPELAILSGQRASKAQLIQTWEGARILYFATHVFRDKEAPYLSYMALSAPDSVAGESYFGVSDVRAVDLESCDLVVLSACASGAPYVTRTFSGASLADAFLDAGAGAAVQTLWDVRDEDARHIMGEFMHHWMHENQPPIRALGDARRRLMGDAEGAAHPFSWAAYSIEIARLPERPMIR